MLLEYTAQLLDEAQMAQASGEPTAGLPGGLRLQGSQIVGEQTFQFETQRMQYEARQPAAAVALQGAGGTSLGQEAVQDGQANKRARKG